MRTMGKREFVTGMGMLAAVTAMAPRGARAAAPEIRQPEHPPAKPLPNRMAKTTRLFKAPGLYPNGLAVGTDGLWVAQQYLTEAVYQTIGMTRPPGKEGLWLMDWTGKLQRTLSSDAINVSGLACGGGALWPMANTGDATTGVYQVNLASGQAVAHKQIPLSPGNISGGIHGAQWRQGKLWIVNNRMHSIVQVDPASWTIQSQFPIATPLDYTRYHDITFDQDGTVLQVVANESKGYADSKSALVRYNVDTGEPIETITLINGSCDPHGLENHNGTLIACDAGFHPGWKNLDSPHSGWIFSIDLI